MKYAVMIKVSGSWMKYSIRKSKEQAKFVARALPLEYKIVKVREKL